MSSKDIKTRGLISVIVPCFNYGRFLGEALESVIAQTYENWECLIIDDGSTDNTREVARQYCEQDSRIKYHYQKNRGTSAAKNKGLGQSKGEFIQFLDADDLIEKEKLNTHVETLNKNIAVGLVYSDSIFFNDKNRSKTGFSKKFDEHPWQKNVSGAGEKIFCEILLQFPAL